MRRRRPLRREPHTHEAAGGGLGEDYDRLWQDAFGHQLAVGARNRCLYSLLGNPGYETMIRILASRHAVVARLRRGRDARELLAHTDTRRMPRIFQVGALLARAFPCSG